MNDEQIIEMAKQTDIPKWYGTDDPAFVAELIAFARLIQQAQREEDARIVEAPHWKPAVRTELKNRAAAIRNSGGEA